MKPDAAAGWRGTGDRAAARGGGGVRHHGREIGRGERGHRAACEYAGDGRMLVALILTFGPISGAHLNPAVTLALAWQGDISWAEVPGYLVAQLCGAFGGVAAAHLMFGEPLFSASQHVRSGGGQMFSEFVATFGLLAVIRGCGRTAPVGRSVCGWRLHHRALTGSLRRRRSRIRP